ncbi:MAG: TldD/PmbA family protein [Promethearchaeota archaeon]
MTKSEETQSLVEQALKVASRHGEAVVRGQDILRHQIRISNSEIDIFKQWRSRVLAVFVAVDGRIGTTEIIDPTPKSLQTRIDHLISFVRGLQPTPLFSGLQKEFRSPSKVEQLYDKRIREFPERAPEVVAASLDEAQKAGAKRTAGSFFFDEIVTDLSTSEGFRGDYRASSYRMTLRSFVDPESSGQGIAVGRVLNDIEAQLSRAGRESGEIASLAVGGKQGKPGTYDLVLHPTVAASILGALIKGANPVQILMGNSPLKDRIGQQLGPETVTIWDDGTIPNGLGSAPFDFEGTPTQRTQIIRKGTLEQLVHNTSSSRMLQTKSTGNCQLAQFFIGSKLMIPGPTNIVFKQGEQSFEELLEPARPTIYVTSNWYLRYTSALEGTFSTIPRDGMFLIEKGEIGQPIQKLRITDNLVRMLGAIDGLGREVRQIRWWEVNTPTFIPFIRIRDVSMTAATQ